MRIPISPRIKEISFGGLLLVGLLQMIGYLTHIQKIRGLGFMTAASPLPLVFSDVEGLETFASSFVVTITDHTHDTFVLSITPQLYSQLRGPYNRRNVYGAAFAYGPKIPEPLWKSVLSYGFCAEGPLAKEFGVTERIQDVDVRVETKTKGRNDAWNLKLSCNL